MHLLTVELYSHGHTSQRRRGGPTLGPCTFPPLHIPAFHPVHRHAPCQQSLPKMGQHHPHSCRTWWVLHLGHVWQRASLFLCSLKHMCTLSSKLSLVSFLCTAHDPPFFRPLYFLCTDIQYSVVISRHVLGSFLRSAPTQCLSSPSIIDLHTPPHLTRLLILIRTLAQPESARAASPPCVTH